MSRQDPEAQNLTADDFEYRSDEETTTTNARPARPAQQAFKSQYTIQTSERLKGVANRIIFSRYYILFYFIMMSLSLTTVVMSLMATHKGICPPKVWHILEIVINGMMVVEVSTRWVAYGKKYPMTILNVLDLLLVAFCSLTLMLVFIWPCSEGAREEEIFDTVLLVIRNAVQFLRLGNILRRSGHSVLNPPKPIDLSQARTASLALDLDLDLSDDEAVAERQLQGGSRRTLAGRGAGGYQPIFTDEVEEETERRPVAPANLAGRDALAEEDEDLWDRVG